MLNISFIGLGNIGTPIAKHISKKHNLTVFNRTTEKAKRFAEENNCLLAENYKEAFSNKDLIVTCVSDDEALRDVYSHAYNHISAKTILIDHSTTSATVAKEIGQRFTNSFLDAPVSGGVLGAEKGVLSIMVGGDKTAFDQMIPLFELYGNSINYMGETGSGQLTKMVNQIAHAGVIQTLSEALSFGVKAGLDMTKVLDVISNGAASSWAMKNRSENMLNGKFDYGFSVDLYTKDLKLCLKQAKELNSNLEVTEIVEKRYEMLQNLEKGSQDYSSLIELL